MGSDGESYCKRGCIFALAFVPVLGAIGLVVAGIVVAQPALTALRLREAMCTVTSSTIGADVTCKCPLGRNCRSSFPCLEIAVLYFEKGGNGTTYSSSMDHNSTGHRSLLVNTQGLFGRTPQCAVRPCGKAADDNYKDVEDYQESWATVGQRFPCFYDPADDAEVSRTVTFNSKWAAFHALFWPLLVIFLSLAAAYFICYRFQCWCDDGTWDD
ncbi:calcium-activated potassium channel subunit beta-4-like [Branchiostoma lanceolatum]|uniref:calcium-activated potassium channel subunit beta-4-like n=1 Tax=Branchiostoma lanceolatum TaxID=7740 RepID=UPI003452B27D